MAHSSKTTQEFVSNHMLNAHFRLMPSSKQLYWLW